MRADVESDPRFSWYTSPCFRDPSVPVYCSASASFLPGMVYESNQRITAIDQAPRWIWMSAGRLPEKAPTTTLHGRFDGDDEWDILRIYTPDNVWRVE